MGTVKESWGREQLFLSQEDLYRYCDQPAGQTEAALGSFRKDSPPYLMATEFPWPCLSTYNFQNRSVLSIAGSGDIPFFFCRMGADPVVTVDVSAPACYFNELKQAALKGLEWKEFLSFFLGGLPRTDAFLKTKSVSGCPDLALLYESLRESVSPSARAFWDERFLRGDKASHPFQPFIRHSDLFFLDQIPYLQNETLYETWRSKIKPYPLLNFGLEVALERAQMRFDVLYASNIVEYSRNYLLIEKGDSHFERYLDRFFESTIRVLNPGGMVCFYFFQSKDSPAFDVLKSDFHPLEERDMELTIHEIHYRSSLLDKSRFRNALLVFKKRSQEKKLNKTP